MGNTCITTDPSPMGLYAHEFGHILGLPDLYDRDDTNGDSEGIGEWCLMASGNWLDGMRHLHICQHGVKFRWVGLNQSLMLKRLMLQLPSWLLPNSHKSMGG